MPFPNPDTQFKQGWEGGPGRSAGYKHWSAELFRWMIETPYKDSKHPFIIDALNKYRELVQEGKITALSSFMEHVFQPGMLQQIDDILSHQKTRDLAYMSYLIYRYCFDEQHALLMTHKPLVAMICGRRAGKTIGLGAFLDDRALHHEKGVGLYLGRTAKSAFEMIWRPLISILDVAQVPYEPHIATQTIVLPVGTEIHVRGRASKEDIENLRGKAYFAAVVDEIQSDPPEKLRYIVKDILEPAGKDFEDSQIVLAGTPPRVPGNYAEEVYQSNRKDVKRLNWNMSVNPHIPASERDLEKTRIQKGFSPTDPTYQREYKGVVGSYDVEALVFKLGLGNHFEEAKLKEWIDSQPITDIFFAGGLDYGFDDFDSASVIMASQSKGERFLLAEYKGHRQSTSDFGNELKRITNLVVSNPFLKEIPDKRWTWFCDTEGLGKQLTHDLASMYSIPVQPAYQGQPDLMVEMLQDDIKESRLKVHAVQQVNGQEVVGEFEKETRKIVFERDERDQLTRRIDDEAFHPEITKSVLYAMRYVWLKSQVKPATTKE